MVINGGFAATACTHESSLMYYHLTVATAMTLTRRVNGGTHMTMHKWRRGLDETPLLLNAFAPLPGVFHFPHGHPILAD